MTKARSLICGAVLACTTLLASAAPAELWGSAPAGGAVSTADARNVELVGHVGGTIDAVAVRGSYVYVGEGPRLTILDVSDPESPVVAGKTMPLQGMVRAISVVGDYAYVAGSVGYYTGWLAIIDVSDPANPAQVGQCAMDNNIYDLAIAGDHAFVADGDLRVVDISNPTNPTEALRYETPDYTECVTIAKDYAYIASKYGGIKVYAGDLRVLDVSDPTNPMEVGSHAIAGAPDDIAVANDRVYVADSDAFKNPYGGLRVLDVSDPANPGEIGFYHCDTFGAMAVAVSGNYAYVCSCIADGALGVLRVLDVSDPANLDEVGSIEIGGHGCGSIAIAGGYAFVDSDCLQIVDASDPTNPVGVSYYSGTLGNQENIAVARDYAYIIGDEGHLWVVDASNPGSPEVVGLRQMLADCGGWNVAVAGVLVYAVNSCDGLRVVDARDPANPMEMGSCDTDGQDMTVVGNYAYVAGDSEGLRVVNVSNPANPVEVGFCDTPGNALGIAIIGDYAYVADYEGGLRVVDVSDPAGPTEVGFHEGLGYTFDVSAADGYVYVTGREGRLWVVDVSNPANPTQVGLYTASGSDAFISDVVAIEDHVYAVTGDGLQVVDVSDPANPTEVGFFTTPSRAEGVAVSGDYIYIATTSGGLFILRLVSGSITGHVVDSQGHPIEGIPIVASGAYTTATSASGQYTITDVLPGTYTLAPGTSSHLWSPASHTVTVPPDATHVNFVGWNVQKQSALPASQALEYGDSLTYTIRLVYPQDRDLVLYDRVPTHTTYISSSLSAPAGVIYDPVANAITGTLNLTATMLTTVSFAARVEVTGTVESAPVIVNQACVHPVGAGLEDCEWSNQVVNFTYVWPFYLSLAFRSAALDSTGRIVEHWE